jgi:conjugative transfer signal peptidase TraF
MTRAIGIAVLSLVAFGEAAQLSGLHINHTKSAPIGIWIERPAGSLKHGSMVSVCPPAVPVVRDLTEQGRLSPGDCFDTGVMPLLKPVAAIVGDVVRIRSGEPVSINGEEVRNSFPASGLKPWPDGDYKVAPGQIWVFSSYSDRSFDSRYFGPVSLSAIRAEVTPLLVFDDKEE